MPSALSAHHFHDEEAAYGWVEARLREALGEAIAVA